MKTYCSTVLTAPTSPTTPTTPTIQTTNGQPPRTSAQTGLLGFCLVVLLFIALLGNTGCGTLGGLAGPHALPLPKALGNLKATLPIGPIGPTGLAGRSLADDPRLVLRDRLDLAGPSRSDGLRGTSFSHRSRRYHVYPFTTYGTSLVDVELNVHDEGWADEVGVWILGPKQFDGTFADVRGASGETGRVSIDAKGFDEYLVLVGPKDADGFLPRYPGIEALLEVDTEVEQTHLRETLFTLSNQFSRKKMTPEFPPPIPERVYTFACATGDQDCPVPADAELPPERSKLPPPTKTATFFGWASEACVTGACGSILDPGLALSHAVVNKNEGPGDGVVAIKSAEFGVYMGVRANDHFHWNRLAVAQIVDVAARAFGIKREPVDRFHAHWLGTLAKSGY